MAFETDSWDYEVLYQAAYNLKAFGLVCEIGTRSGGSTKFIIDGLVDSKNHNRSLVCIDPYGNLPYSRKENEIVTYDYDNELKNYTFNNLFGYIQDKQINLIPMIMEDSEFFKRFSDGVPCYIDNKKFIENNYALVFFDGPHNAAAVLNETQFFNDRSIKGTNFVYDDWRDFDFEPIEKFLLQNNWNLIISKEKKKNFIK